VLCGVYPEPRIEILHGVYPERVMRSFTEFTLSHELDPSLPLRMTAEGLRMTGEGFRMTAKGSA